ELKLSSVDAGVGLRAAFEHLRPGKLAQVMVVDTGMGMTAEVQEKIFEPLFTTKAEGIGTGLGLASAKRIVEEHKGAIAVESSPGQGTRFTVYLPVIDRTSHEPQPADLVYLGGTERVLVVDDEPEVAKATGTALAALGYVVEVCHSPIDALELVGATDEPFQLVVTDQVMPRMPGLELAARLKALHPETPIILLSGTATEEILRKAEAVGVELVLSKPVTRSALARAVRGELDR
ncbi:MAG: response regulator, partial [Myxococcota bacterium]|nr:response regulator [Myxococcota bacterium]